MNRPSTITLGEFARWSIRAEVGDRIEYCAGEGTFAIANTEEKVKGSGIRSLFDIVYRSYKSGNVALFQQVIHGTTHYIAVKTTPEVHAKIKELSNV